MNNTKTGLLLSGIILITFLNCTGETDDRNNSERISPNSDVESRAISPQKEYTKENPAEWQEVANDHLPEIVFNKSQKKENISVKVLGKKFSERHYIEVIGIMDDHYADLDFKNIEKGKLPYAILSLNTKEQDPEKVKVFVKCNLHDLWTVQLIPKVE